MSGARTVSDVLRDHVALELECVDRMYLNVYVPLLQRPQGVAHYLREMCGYRVPSSALLVPRTRDFVAAIGRFVKRERIDLIRFHRGERKDDRAQDYLRRYRGDEGVLFVAVAQEKAHVPHTERRRRPNSGSTYPWLVSSTARVNHYYYYLVDEDFGPLFIKFCSFFPFNVKLCLNGHEYLKRQLAREGIAYEELDNGIFSCAKPQRMQELAAGLSAARIDGLLRKWLARLPCPFSAADERAGICYELSILQAEFSLTQVLDRPLHGRAFFENLIRENLDLGRPDQVRLIFDRRIYKSTRSHFRTRVITDGVEPSLHVDYKHSRIKQYHKEGRALRTETIINDSYDFDVGRRLSNLDQLKELGFSTNRRLLCVQRLSHNCQLGDAAFATLQQPRVAADSGQRTAGLRFGCPRVQALLCALLAFRLLPRGFDNRQLRAHLAPLLGVCARDWTAGQMTYDLRRLRLHGLIERIPRSRRYRVTARGIRVALCYQRTYARMLRPTLAAVFDSDPPRSNRLQRTIEVFDREIDRLWEGHELAA